MVKAGGNFFFIYEKGLKSRLLIARLQYAYAVYTIRSCEALILFY